MFGDRAALERYRVDPAAAEGFLQRCRNREAPISLKRRRWDDPGFAQGGTQKVFNLHA